MDNGRQPRCPAPWDLPSYAAYDFVEGDIRDEAARAEGEAVVVADRLEVPVEKSSRPTTVWSLARSASARFEPMNPRRR
jgi:hypothetical protein